MDTNRFVQGIPIHPPDPNVFLYTDASHFGWGAQIESMTLSFHGHWSQDKSQLHINMLEIMAIRFALNKKFYTPFLCHDFYRQHNSGLLYQQATHSPNLCVEAWKILKWWLKQHIVVWIRHIPGKFNVSNRPIIENG